MESGKKWPVNFVCDSVFHFNHRTRLKLRIVAGDVMVRILLNGGVQREKFHFSLWTLSFNIILTITSPAVIYSFHPSLISTTLGTYLSRIMIESMMMAF
jgi:hypothetical protein